MRNGGNNMPKMRPFTGWRTTQRHANLPNQNPNSTPNPTPSPTRDPTARSQTVKRALRAVLCGALSLASVPSTALAAGTHAASDLYAASGSYGNRSPGKAGPAQPIPREAIERMHAEAEDAYRARRWSEAMQAFNAIVVLDPSHAQAWLRIGNLHHRRHQLLSAASAYRKAAKLAGSAVHDDAQQDSASPPDKGQQPSAPGAIAAYDMFGTPREPRSEAAPRNAALRDHVRAKALINLALVNVELAQAALAELGEVPADLVRARDDAAASVARVRGDVERRKRRHPGAGSTSHLTNAASLGSGVGRGTNAAASTSAAEGAGVANSAGVASSAISARPDIDYLDGIPTP